MRLTGAATTRIGDPNDLRLKITDIIRYLGDPTNIGSRANKNILQRILNLSGFGMTNVLRLEEPNQNQRNWVESCFKLYRRKTH